VKEPNFFIIGAPKCGTTSIANWLGQCPGVFLPTLKEPNYFNADRRVYDRLEPHEYQHLFHRATESHIAVGEASTAYLRSSIAVPNILRYAPRAKFICCVRNPVTMCVSWHKQNLTDGVEQERSFERAWTLQAERASGHRIPNLCADGGDLLYGPVCKIGSQLRRAVTAAGRDNVLVISLDDIAAQPLTVYNQVLSFLGISNNFTPEFQRYNKAIYLPRPIARGLLYARLIKRRLRIDLPTGMARLAVKAFAQEASIGEPSDHFLRSVLYPYFAGEVDILESILDQDLSAWREPPSVGPIRATVT